MIQGGLLPFLLDSLLTSSAANIYSTNEGSLVEEEKRIMRICIKKRRRGKVMKSLVTSALSAILTGILDAKREKISFTITCSECGCLGELENYFPKESGDIAVVNGDGIGENGENIVSIRCNKCGNRIVSSEF